MTTRWSTGPVLCGFEKRWQAETPPVHHPQRAQRHAMRSSSARIREQDNCPQCAFPAPSMVREP
jgi:hypothetical protein